MESKTPLADLLAHRDGEELPDDVVRGIEGDPAAQRDLRTLRGIRQELNALPPVQPDPALWEEINRRAHPSRSWTLRYPLATAATVFVAAALTIVAWNPLRKGGDAAGPGPVLVADGALVDLMSRSQVLESHLPVQGTPAGQLAWGSAEEALRYRIADIDAELMRLYETEPLDVERREALWRQRVDLLESLTEVQRGQAVVRPAIY
ncbi:MAG: hypothetical protein GWM88_01135 [Pseudomonadales bacterium]|nr:hypothetical protein [Pseudomonadales bacterium]NIX06693.1 hypothetical protein [Pseudomonadales bacterium]